ncbi:DDE family transposase [Algoriphagus antarcticus]|nr:IS4 family transposase [Algoriphagus antarcticus]REG85346.1 DDE family transposase [Algoriphagus antarcticus]
MVLTSVQQDKTLKNSVDLYYMIHQQHKQQATEALEEQLNQEKVLDQSLDKKAGRPKKYTLQLPKSLEKDISLNTAAYSKARERVPMALAEELFSNSRISEVNNSYSHWYGYRVLIGDGTYVQMQDTERIREEYEVKYHGQSNEGYPQGLLESISERGTGQVVSFKLSNRHVSELALFYEMIDEVPIGSVLLLDDLYNCYEIIAKCKRKGIEMLMPAKRERSYELIEVLSEGDEIIRIKPPKKRSEWLEPNTFLLRRIVCKSPEGKEYVLHTTILDAKIDKHEFQLLYLTRWDIEISIREIKTIMDVNILRSKTPEMALKELTVSLATYNLIRKIIYASIKDLPFSPKEDFIQKFYTLNKDFLIDKKGRVYNRWSTGRRRTGTPAP